jgi:hypothetical protein
LLFDIGGEMTCAAVVQAAASIVGFGVLIYQVAHLRKNIRGATQDRLYAHYNEVCKLFMQRPELYPYFYEDVKLSDSDSDVARLRVEINLACETIYGLIEHSVLQKRNLPPDAWAGCWKPYAFERLDKSTELRNYFNPNEGWYTKALHEVVDQWSRSKHTQPKANLRATGMFEGVSRSA